MVWWIYFSGVIITALMCVLIAYRDWNKGGDVTMYDILVYSVSSFLSWVGFIVSVFAYLTWLINEHRNDVIIKGKKH